MTAFNVVKFDVKPECVTDFITLTSKKTDLVPCRIRRVMIKTGGTRRIMPVAAAGRSR